MPASDSPARFVVLGMLGLGARSGYDVKRLCDLSTRFFWRLSHAQIYPELKRLEKEGLVVGSEEPRGDRRRKVYTLTGEGETALERWLSDDDELGYELRDLGLVKLFLADALESERALDLLDRIRERGEHLGKKLAESLAAAEALDQSGKRFPLIALRYGMELQEWTAQWCHRLESELRDR